MSVVFISLNGITSYLACFVAYYLGLGSLEYQHGNKLKFPRLVFYNGLLLGIEERTKFS